MNCPVCTDELETTELCAYCNGTGEGFTSDTKCYECNASGTVPTKEGGYCNNCERFFVASEFNEILGAFRNV